MAAATVARACGASPCSPRCVVCGARSSAVTDTPARRTRERSRGCVAGPSPVAPSPAVRKPAPPSRRASAPGPPPRPRRPPTAGARDGGHRSAARPTPQPARTRPPAYGSPRAASPCPRECVLPDERTGRHVPRPGGAPRCPAGCPHGRCALPCRRPPAPIHPVAGCRRTPERGGARPRAWREGTRAACPGERDRAPGRRARRHGRPVWACRPRRAPHTISHRDPRTPRAP